MNSIDKLIEELKNKQASEVITGIYNYQDSHKYWVVNNKNGFVSYFEPSYDFYVSLVSSLNYVEKKNWGWKKSFPFIYMGNSTYPLFKAYTLAIEGFYDQSLTVCREALELLIKSIFCVCYPDDALSTFARPEKGRRTFNLSNFLKDDLKLKSEFLYRLPSGTAHGKLYLARVLNDFKNGKSSLIGLQLKLDEKMFNSNMNYLTFLTWAHIYLLTVLFDELAPMENINKKVKKEAHFYIKTLGHIVKSTPTGFGEAGEEFEKIIKIIKLANDNKDWNKIA